MQGLGISTSSGQLGDLADSETRQRQSHRIGVGEIDQERLQRIVSLGIAERAHQKHGACLEGADDVPEQLHGRVSRPVQVVEHEHH